MEKWETCRFKALHKLKCLSLVDEAWYYVISSCLIFQRASSRGKVQQQQHPKVFCVFFPLSTKHAHSCCNAHGDALRRMRGGWQRDVARCESSASCARGFCRGSRCAAAVEQEKSFSSATPGSPHSCASRHTSTGKSGAVRAAGPPLTGHRPRWWWWGRRGGVKQAQQGGWRYDVTPHHRTLT